MSDLASLEQAISSIWGLSGRITHLKEGDGGLGDVGGLIENQDFMQMRLLQYCIVICCSR